MVASFNDLSMIQYDDLICIFNRRNSLCDNNLCCVRDLLAESLTYQGICSCIYCTGRVIQDQDLRFLEKSPCNTQNAKREQACGHGNIHILQMVPLLIQN